MIIMARGKGLNIADRTFNVVYTLLMMYMLLFTVLNTTNIAWFGG